MFSVWAHRHTRTNANTYATSHDFMCKTKSKLSLFTKRLNILANSFFPIVCVCQFVIGKISDLTIDTGFLLCKWENKSKSCSCGKNTKISPYRFHRGKFTSEIKFVNYFSMAEKNFLLQNYFCNNWFDILLCQLQCFCIFFLQEKSNFPVEK